MKFLRPKQFGNMRSFGVCQWVISVHGVGCVGTWNISVAGLGDDLLL